MIIATDIGVTLGGKQILSGLSFSARAGEVTAIVGPNGSGKTTLLRALTQDVKYHGDISVNDRRVDAYAPWELAAVRAVLPQAASLAFPFTVREVVKLGLAAGIHGDRAELVEAALARVGLVTYADRTFHELSGGEQQRAHLARVLCQVWDPSGTDGPRWLLLDEPVASLDIAHQLQVMDILTDFAARGGGVIAVMHDLNLTAMVADNIAIIAGGTMIAQGSTVETFQDGYLSDAYGCELRTNTLPSREHGFVLPQAVTA